MRAAPTTTKSPEFHSNPEDLVLKRGDKILGFWKAGIGEEGFDAENVAPTQQQMSQAANGEGPELEANRTESVRFAFPRGDVVSI